MIDSASGGASLPKGVRDRHFAAALAGVSCVYFLLGLWGVGFAIPPGYASPIFPASGFAVAAMLWSRCRLWPGIWLGSFAMNLATSGWNGAMEPRNLLLAAGIASGSTVQATVAWWLVLRFVKDSWRRLQAEQEIVLCLAMAGPVACVVSAAVGVTVLCILGVVSVGDAPYAWLNWWMGDVLGVWITLPLSLALFYWRDPLWRGRLLTQVLPVLLVLGMVAGAFFGISKWERSQEQLRIEKHGEALMQALQQRFVAHQEALAALRRLVEVTPDMTLAKFEYFTRITLSDNPDIFALSINPYVTREGRPDFERRMRMPNVDFEIRERDSLKHLVRAQERPEYVVVGFIAPRKDNVAALGFDINSDRVRSDAIRRARSTGSAAVTAPVQLVQENQKRHGVLLLHPTYQIGTGVVGDASGNELMGFVVGVIKVDEMMEIATRAIDDSKLHVSLEDERAPKGESLLYQNEASAMGARSEFVWTGKIAVADRFWTLSVRPTAAYEQGQRYWLALLSGSGGLVLAAMLQVLLLGTTARTSVVQSIVREQTKELRLKRGDLEDRNAQLNSIFALSPDGFVAVDHGGLVRFVNPAFETMTGIRAGELVGQAETQLHAELLRRSEISGVMAAPSTTFRKFGDGLTSSMLTLKVPRHAVIQMVGIKSEASSVARILYFRDVTAEAEVDLLKSEFLSTAAHELRTPMASVFGFAEVLMTQELDESERTELLGIIYKQSGLMANILNELLDLARIEARRGKDFVFEALLVQGLLKDVVAGFKLPPNRMVPVSALPQEPHFIMADRSKVGQAIVNVLSNAYKYSPSGGTVEIELVESPASAVNPMLGFRISDHGIGMTSEQQSRIFERFYRVDTSGKIPGTGLGMSIVKEIVDLHGGHVEVSSVPGVGSSVTLWFPVPPPG